MVKIYLASGSPRRYELLKLLFDDFEVVKSDFEEDNDANIDVYEKAKIHALGKGRDVMKNIGEGIVISADTFCVFEGKVFGKPKDESQAEEFLKKISGNVIYVISGVAVIDVKSETEKVEVVLTKVFIDEIDDIEIKEYVKSGEPLDKAGAFAIQGRGGVFVKKIEGDYYNVVGLPINTLKSMLKEFLL